MLRSIGKLFVSSAVVVLVCCSSAIHANATVFRDRASFNAASQNLITIDFESPPNIPKDLSFLEFDGVIFRAPNGPTIVTGQNGNKLMRAGSLIEFVRLTISLPPGTTAVGVDEFNRPMIVATSTGESVTMEPSDASNFVGFVSDQPIDTLTVSFDFPEPTPDVLIDNLTFGQRRAGNEPPVPLLLATNGGRAVALDSVSTMSEPFRLAAPHPLSPDGRTRVTLFVVGVLLGPADLPFVSVQAQDTQQRLFDLPVEATDRAKNVSWMSQVTVRLPDALAGAGDLNVTVTVGGKVSNSVPFRIE
jgi:hypothetical protein